MGEVIKYSIKVNIGAQTDIVEVGKPIVQETVTEVKTRLLFKKLFQKLIL
jgi:hypothetical protein